MFKMYLRTGWRNIIRNKWTAFINVFGLSVGLAASIILYVYIDHETGYDQFHKEKDLIYRVITTFDGDGDNVLPRTFPVVAQLLPDDSPLVEKAVRIRPESYHIKTDGNLHPREEFLLTDPNFVQMFDFKVIAGDLTATLQDPYSVAITPGLAEMLFGSDDPLNQIIEVETSFIDREMQRLSQRYIPVHVGAIVENESLNTHLEFSVLQSFESIDPNYSSTFSNDVFVYLQSTQILNQRDIETTGQLIKEYIVERFGEPYRDRVDISLQKLTDIHFGPIYGYDMGPRGNKRLIHIFIAVAIFILVIAIINFVNIVTARSEKRATEAAIRKVSGAQTPQIIMQFLGESILITFMAMLFALILAEIMITPVGQLLNRDLSLLSNISVQTAIMIMVLIVLIGTLSGIYPAILFSSYNPALILKGKSMSGSRNPFLRIMLIIIQFGISVLLIITILVFNRQIDYMKNADLGFSPKNVLIFSGLTDKMITRYDAIKAEIESHPGIIHVASSQAFPGRSGSGMSIRKSDAPENMSLSVTEYRTGRNFQETFNIRLKEGRWFDYDSPTDIHNFVVNEAVVKSMGLVNPVGEEVIMWKRKGNIIGVVEDFHFTSLKNQIQPLVLSAYSPAFYFISVKITETNADQTIDHIKNTFQAFDPSYLINETYLDTFFQNLYRQEENNNRILSYASTLAVIIAMMGIFGLSSYIIMARTREIGIRKVMGASTVQIIVVLFKDIIRWVLLANLLIWPLAWLLMIRWLEGFPYRINMSVLYLFIAGVVSLAIVAIAISGQTINAARKNPVDALKAE